MSISLIVNIRQSRFLTALLSAMSIAACCSTYLFLAALNVSGGLKLFACLSVSLLILLHVYRLLKQPLPFQLVIQDEGHLLLIYPDHRLRVVLCKHSVIWPKLMALRLISGQDQIVNLILFPDSVDEKSFHRLKVSLLYMKRRYSSDDLFK
jgi:hypothetical protein